MNELNELENIYNQILQKKGLIKLEKKNFTNKIIANLISDLKLYNFEKSINKVFNKSNINDENDFFKKIYSFLKIFLKDGIFFYYFYEENSDSYDIFNSEIDNYDYIASIQEAIEEGIVNLVSNLNEIRSFENIYYEKDKTYITPIPIFFLNKKIGVIIGLSKYPIQKKIDLIDLFYILIKNISPLIYSFQLRNQLNQKQHKLSLMIDVTEDLSYIKPLNENIKAVIKSLSQSIHCPITALILVKNSSEAYFKYTSKEFYPLILKKSWKLSLENTDIFSESINKKLSFVINNMSKNRLYLKTYNIVSDQIKSFLVYPLDAVNFKGCFFAGRLKDESLFTHEEYDLVMTMIKNLGIFLNNISLFNEVKISYELTTSALASAIEAKDPYTKGHSQRVMRYSLLIGKKLGLNESQLRTIKLAGLLHDVGKIGIPEAIILKKGPLNEQEYKIMKRHPYIGYLIVKDINYLKPGIPFVLYHHEKLDGTGYPYGLKDDQIPLFARIASVADYFDALTSDRPYRKGLSFNEAINDIKKNSGKVFDKEIVDAFVKGLKS